MYIVNNIYLLFVYASNFKKLSRRLLNLVSTPGQDKACNAGVTYLF